MHNLPCYNKHFVLSLAISKNDMMIQMVDKPNTTTIGQISENFDLQSFALFKCSCSRSSMWTVMRGVYPIVERGSHWLPHYNEYFCC